MADESVETAKIVPVGEHVFVRQEIDNMGWVDLGDTALVVDALEHGQKKQEVFGQIRQTLGDKCVRYLLNTHTHYDHVALNDAFFKQWGTQIVNRQTADIPAEGRWFSGSERRVQMAPMGGIHTEDDCIVWEPEARVLFVGDLFGWGLIPTTRPLRNEQARLLLDTYATLTEYEADTVVPGHGPLCDTGTLQCFADYVRWLIEGIANGAAQGASDAELLQRMKPPSDMTGWWRFLEWKHEDSFAKVLRQIRKGNLDTSVLS